MAKSKYEYVKKFEQDDTLLRGCWIVVRIDGRSFHKFSNEHQFTKPNDVQALNLMNACAQEVMRQFNDVIIAYGQSDEYSFVLHKKSTLFGRRSSKIMTNMVSLFSSSYGFLWKTYFDDKELKYAPMFDARTVLYPSNETLRDYLSWRQADCHINNLYNTCFWSLVLKGGYSEIKAEEELCGTMASDKNELLFSKFDLNYNKESEMFRKGSVLHWVKEKEPIVNKNSDSSSEQKYRLRPKIAVCHKDIIGDAFWETYCILNDS